ncbi:MAG: endonuclease MutS2 [bacterium]|nr:endonuclease MutS2 [bacterium]
MNPRTLETLEFDRVRDLLAERASFSLGVELGRDLVPCAEAEEVAVRQEETAEAREILDRGAAPPLGGLHDVREAAGRAGRGGRLNPAELLAIADTVQGGSRLKRFLQGRRETVPRLAGRAGFEPPLTLAQTINRCIDEQGGVADAASPELARVRRRLRVVQDRVRSALESLVRSSEMQRYLQEPIITMRQNRFVIPVRQEYRSRVPGVVHDQSASGATVFVEPLRVLELNNELRSLEAEEREEVDRILAALSAAVGEVAGELERLVAAAGHLDHVFARARLARDLEAVRPEADNAGYLELIAARHPLLRPEGGEVVPIDIRLGRDFQTMVITGPNTGGKTVTLKTVGLLALMYQSGLQLPAGAGSRMPVYRGIYCDIGDEQSIEQNLSTFSGHLTNILGILPGAGPGSLVLLDEVGAGTDPREGSVLAMALLERLQAAGAHTVATTHYGELKLFAHASPGMVNASVEFDPETLRPTFRLLTGVPGRSNALDIAVRLGLGPDLAARARRFLSRDEVAVDDLLRDVERERAALVEERRRLEVAARDAEEMRRRLEELLATARARDREAVEKNRRELREILARARRQVEAAVRELKETRQEAARSDRGTAEAVRRARRSLEGLEAEAAGGIEELLAAPAPTGEPLEPGELKPGLEVLVQSLGLAGVVLEAGEPVQVQIGAVRVVVPRSDLARAAAPAPARRERVAGPELEKATSVAPELHLRGLTVEEALERLDKYLDDACLAGLARVRVVHGKGTGTLRGAVRACLEAHPRVTGVRPGEPGEGGDGVTVAELAT